MIKIGVIGAGHNGVGHARYFAQCGRAQVVAIADPDEQRAAAGAQQCGARAVADFHEFLDEVDAVVISSPNFLHRDHAVECARAGKHVFCEKPMGLNLQEARDIADAIAQTGVQSLVAFSVRFTEPVQTMQRYLREGRLGRLVSLWSRRLTYADHSRGASWRRDHALSGGVLYEINIHELEWMMALAGRDVRTVFGRVWAEGQASPRANDHIWFVLDFADGVVASHEGSHRSPSAEYQRGVIGTDGGMITDRWSRSVFFTPLGQKEVQIPLDPAFDKRGHFLDCIEGKAVSVADARWGLKVMAVAEAILESAASGRAVCPQPC